MYFMSIYKKIGMSVLSTTMLLSLSLVLGERA
ncbi:hypothetical protein IAW_04919 [Bacillus cereus str. Schrouff]|nr:hypothetical protein IAW_04919 [Bacillus cereus str. Schrouff]EOO81958.1 hypothetical protein IGY_05460 [Bacillus cereus K-5975c]MCP1399399.1 hypothetical protein [Bacillus cereus]